MIAVERHTELSKFRSDSQKASEKGLVCHILERVIKGHAETQKGLYSVQSCSFYAPGQKCNGNIILNGIGLLYLHDMASRMHPVISDTNS
jgi:hypothetical protein